MSESNTLKRSKKTHGTRVRFVGKACSAPVAGASTAAAALRFLTLVGGGIGSARGGGTGSSGGGGIGSARGGGIGSVDGGTIGSTGGGTIGSAGGGGIGSPRGGGIGSVGGRVIGSVGGGGGIGSAGADSLSLSGTISSISSEMGGRSLSFHRVAGYENANGAESVTAVALFCARQMCS